MTVISVTQTYDGCVSFKFIVVIITHSHDGIEEWGGFGHKATMLWILWQIDLKEILQ